MKIKNLDLIYQYKNIKTEIDNAILRVLDSGHFILGNEVDIFEQNIADYLGLNKEHIISCASGSDALLLSLMSIDIEPGDEVITTSFSFFATAGCISRLGAKIVFAETGDDFNIDTESIKKNITNRTKAIISVDLYGCPCDQKTIRNICKKKNIKFISDSAQSIGSEIDGKKIGTIADFTTFSFFPTKNLGCYGDGGLVVSLNKKLANKIRQLRTHGSIKKYHHNYIGLNSRLDAIQAAVLSVKLKYLDLWVENRKKIAKIYNDQIQFKNPQSSLNHVYHQYTICSTKRNKLQEHLYNHGISSTVYYPKPLHLQKCFDHLGYMRGDFPKTELHSKRVLSIPIYESLTNEEVSYIIDIVNKF